jgi:hypothetical protein
MEHDPAAPIFRHLLELLDGIGLLVRSSSGYPAFGLLRGVVEAFMSMRYILQEDSERRALAYKLAEIHRRIAIEKTAIEGTHERAQLDAKRERDQFTKDTAEFTPLAGAAEVVGKMQAILESEKYTPIESEFQAVKKKTRRNPAWYSLFGGPPNLEQLAERVGLPLIYEILYRYWSEEVHSTGVRSGRILPANDGTAALVQLRDPTPVQQVTSFAVTFSLAAIQVMVDHFVPEKKAELRAWYIRELRDRHMKLHGEQVLNIIYNFESWAETTGPHPPTSKGPSVRPMSRVERRRRKFGR